MKPKVSIIIPVYNGEKTVRRCLESVLSQSVREIEVLCINDGSTETMLPLASFAEIQSAVNGKEGN